MSKIQIFIMAFISWLTPLTPFFFLTGIGIAFDTYFGVRLAMRNKAFKSRQFARVLYKFLIYNVIIISGYGLDKYVIGSFVGLISDIDLTVTKAIVFGVLCTEMISIDEKLRELNGKGLRYYFLKVFGVVKFLNNERKNL